MSWFLKLVICLGFLFSANHFSEAKHQKKLPSAVVIGTVYCDTCFQQDFSKANHFIPGASVEIQCKETGSRGGFRQEAKTNNHGEFKFDLPVSVSKHAKNIRGCSITLLRSNEPFCAVAASATSSSLRLKSRKEGTHIFSAGFFSFKPLKQPEICNQKSNPTKRLSPHSNSKKHTDQLPFPFPPVIPPNPLLPPPSLIPPVLPTPPPSLIPPVLPTPPTPPSLPVPLIPGLPPVPLVPSPPPTPPPTLPVPLPPVPGMPAIPGLPPVPGLPAIPGVPPVPGLVPSPQPPKPTLPVPTPLPPFPFQPTPGLPGVPPAEVSRTSSP